MQYDAATNKYIGGDYSGTDTSALLSTAKNSLGYRDYLQKIKDAGGFSSKEADALLQVVGNDGNFWINDPENTQIMGTQTDNGQTSYYGQKGLTDLNNVYLKAFYDANSGVLGDNTSKSSSTSSSSNTYVPSAADERAAYDDQISAIDKLLGYTDKQKESGLGNIKDSYDDEIRTLEDQKTRTINDYATKDTENMKSQESGLNEVDSYAGNSLKSLMRLLQGANAGNSAVSQKLIPYLVSKSAGTRRSGVFNNAAENTRNIDMARKDAEYQYGQNAQDFENQRKNQEQSFLETIMGRQNDLDTQKKDLQIKRQMATGAGYQTARAAGDASQSNIDSRMNELASLFSTYKPTYTAKQMTLQTPSLKSYSMDKTGVETTGNLPAESGYYLSQLINKKKQEQY